MFSSCKRLKCRAELGDIALGFVKSDISHITHSDWSVVNIKTLITAAVDEQLCIPPLMVQ